MIRGELTTCDLVITGDPMPQPRPLPVMRGKRIAMIATKSGNCSDYRSAIQLAAKDLMGVTKANPATGPLFVELTLVWDRVGRVDKIDADKRIWRDNGPDVDNVAKAVLDACNGILWDDDRQVVCLTVKKFYGRVGESAHTRILVRAFTGG